MNEKDKAQIKRITESFKKISLSLNDKPKVLNEADVLRIVKKNIQPPSVINHIVKEVIKEKPQIIKETIETVRVDEDEINKLKGEFKALAGKVDNLESKSSDKILHSELLGVDKDDHHKEKHEIESHADSEMMKRLLHLTKGYGDADEFHTHKSGQKTILMTSGIGSGVSGGGTSSLSGTINEIAYFNTATTIASLAVATYPSLTELSYVKGVTSAIQTQLGGKQATLTFGIADTNSLRVDDATAADNDYAKFTANGLEGVSYATVLSDIGAAAVAQTFFIGTTQVAINRASAALTLAGITLTTPDIGTPSAGTLTNCTGLPEAGLLDNAVTLAKMAGGTDGNLITYDASGDPAYVATGNAGQVLTSNGAGAAPTFQAAGGGGPMTLLKAGSGSSAATGATDVDTIAITGLTALDTLLVFVSCEEATTDVAYVGLYNSTDNVLTRQLFGGGVLAAADFASGEAFIRQGQSANTVVISGGYANSGGGGRSLNPTKATFTTAWTGNWTLALRHGGVTATGSFKWSWSVYKVAGQ